MAPQRADAQLTGLVTCAATAASPTVRAEGTMELVGDILLTCTANDAFPATNQFQTNLSVSLNVNVTNAVEASNVSDAVVLVNENDCASPSATGGTFGSCGAADSRVQDPQLGVLAAANRLEWNTLAFPYPGAPAGDGTFFPFPTTVRITGIRANAMQLGVPASAPPTTQITAFVSLTGPTTIAVTNNVLNVAIPSSDVLNGPSDPDLVTGVSCSTTATPLPVDPAGVTEPLGDLLAVCGTVGAPPPAGSSVTLDLGLQLNTGITNDDLPSPSPPELFVNEGAPLAGTIDREDRVVWRTVTFPVPAPGEETTLRIAGVRGDVATLMGGGATFPSTQVTGQVLFGIPVTSTMHNLGAPFAPSSPAPVDGYVGLNPCQLTSVPPVVRAEGITEIVGDIVMICNNVDPARVGGIDPPGTGITTASVLADISLSLNADVTNNIGFGPGADLTDAVLIVNENNCTSPAAAGGVFGSCGAADPRVQDPQYGRLTAPNRIEWRGVRLPVPGSSATGSPVADCTHGGTMFPGEVASGCFPFTTALRVSSLRARASQSGIPDVATFPSTQITGFLSIDAVSFSVTTNVSNVAVPILAMRSTIFDPNGLNKVAGDGQIVPQGEPVPLVVSSFREGMPRAGTSLNITVINPGQPPALTCPLATITDDKGIGRFTCTTGAILGGGSRTVQVQVSDFGRSLREPFEVTVTSSNFGLAQTLEFVSEEPFRYPEKRPALNVPLMRPVADIRDPVRPKSQLVHQCVGGVMPLGIAVQEGFATAFKTNGDPTFYPGNVGLEAGYFAPGSNLGGGASQGSRLVLRLTGVPEGVSLTAPKLIETGDPLLTQDALRLEWVAGADETGAGGAVSGDTGDLTIESPPGGMATVVYEVTDSNPFQVESVAVPMNVSWDPAGEGGPPATGAIQAQVLLAPVSTVLEASFPAPEPRFEAHGDPSTILTITPCAPPEPVSVSPASGAGSGGTFTFTFQDPDGWQDLDVVNALVNFWLDGRNSCYLAYSRPQDSLFLVDDAGGGLSAPLQLGSANSVSNSQCTIHGAGSSASGNGDTLTLTLNMSFAPAYAGTKIVYLAARDAAANNSGWRRMGVWTAPGLAATSPAVVGMSPQQGGGSGPATFDFVFSDTDGWQDLGVVNVLVNDWLDGRDACYLAYSRPENRLYLVNDAGDGLLPALELGSAGSVSNSQCTVHGTGSSTQGSGDTLTLKLNMSFSGTFSGNRVFYLAARDGAENNSGWQAGGSWTAP